MPVSPSTHLDDKPFMSEIKGLQMPPPSQDFRVARIALLVLRQDAPYCMKLPVLSHKMATAESLFRYVPYSHLTVPLRRGS